MGAGVFLMIVGAILTFAVRADTPAVDLQVVGVIFMVAAAVVIYHARKGTSRARNVTTVEDRTDPQRPVRRVHETVTEQDPGDYPRAP